MKKLKSIFLVDDNEDDRFFFIKALEKIENATLYGVAGNGKEALHLLQNAETLPDLIVTDINMPVMDGIECLTEIIKNPQTKNIPVVILSSATEQKELARELGAKAFIEKPGNGGTLREHLEQMINSDFIADSPVGNQTFETVPSVF